MGLCLSIDNMDAYLALLLIFLRFIIILMIHDGHAHIYASGPELFCVPKAKYYNQNERLKMWSFLPLFNDYLKKYNICEVDH